MEDDDDMPQSSVNFIPCLYFLKKAVAKEKPEKVNSFGCAETWYQRANGANV